MSLEDAGFEIRDTSFPRVSGDEPQALDERERAGKFSPRERG